MQLTKFAEERDFLAITSSQLGGSLEVWDLKEPELFLWFLQTETDQSTEVNTEPIKN